MHAGEVSYDEYGVTAASVDLPFRSRGLPRDGAAVAGFGAGGAGGGRGGTGRAGGQYDGLAPAGELAAHLAADPAIAAGNQRYGAHIVDCPHDM